MRISEILKTREIFCGLSDVSTSSFVLGTRPIDTKNRTVSKIPFVIPDSFFDLQKSCICLIGAEIKVRKARKKNNQR